jgi:hypothetical protein
LRAPNRPPRVCDRPATTERLIACGRCRQTYRSTALRRLELVEVLDSNCVRQVLSDWPSGHSIEVRRCKRRWRDRARIRTGEAAPARGANRPLEIVFRPVASRRRPLRVEGAVEIRRPPKAAPTFPRRARGPAVRRALDPSAAPRREPRRPSAPADRPVHGRVREHRVHIDGGEEETPSCPKSRPTTLCGLPPVVGQYSAEAFVASDRSLADLPER